jgi:uncharacterized protein involved in outer membrane biogenesis
LAWSLATLVLVWALGWLVVPPLVRSQLERVGSEQLGRNLRVGAVDFKPWTLELTLHDLALASQDGARAQFQLKRLYANVELESLLRLAPVIESVALDAPHLRLTHLGAGRYDIDDLLARFDRPAPTSPSDPLHFALFNLALSAGVVEFEDRPVQKMHVLNDLALGVPFLSNLPARHQIKVEPRLAFSLNGSRFDSSAQTTPFAATRKTEAVVALRDFDLAPYVAYLPAGLPVRLQKGVLGATLKLDFEQAPHPRVQLSGELLLRAAQASDSSGKDLLALDALKVVLADVRPLEQVASLALVELNAPQLDVSRNAAGELNLLPPGDPLAAAPSAAASQAVARQAAAAGGWKASIASLVVRDGLLRWSDGAVQPQARLAAQNLTLDASDIRWPMDQPATFQGSVAITDNTGPATGGKATVKGGPVALAFSGTASDREARVKASVVDLPLSLAHPYLAQFLNPALQGRLRSEIELAWRAPELMLTLASLELSDLALLPRGAPAGLGELPSVQQISLSQAQIDLAKRSVVIGKLVVGQPRVAVARARDKRWMFEDWLKPMPTAPSAPTDLPWSLLVRDLALQGGEVSYRDDAASRPVAFALSALKLQVKDLRPDGRTPVALQASARVRSERAEPGQLDYRGTLQWQPVAAQGSVVATQIPVHVFEPYFGAGLNIELLRADAGFKGDVRYAEGSKGPSVQVKGDAVVEDFRAHSVGAGEGGLQIAEELLNWKTLSLRGIDLALAPQVPTRLAVTETTLGDFFARVIVRPNGRINLQDLVKSDAPVAAAAPVQAGASALAAPNAVVQAAPPAAASGLEPVITIGPVGLVNGKVFFSDRFVKPNYSANLSELTGRLSAFSSVAPQGQPQLADLELRGRAEGTASLEILGKINPLATPLALDIKGIVRDLELPPLSPYSIKYAGHGIERGKLSVDVAYLVRPDGQLTATNQVVLNQLTFGDKVEGAPASLPVKLAVALLSDRNGVIDINLPISGSLNDPQFSLGPIIFKVIVNLVVKAITAPFSLLASAFGGGGDELGTVAFAPGSAVLLPQAKAGLDKVAQALTDRPALKMTVVGTASLDVEREAYKHERLRGLLVSEKRRSLLAGPAPAAEAGAALTVGEGEVPALLKEVYKRADITKPRNLEGQAKELPTAEMEALLLANIPVTDDAMRELALQRGVAVKDYLGGRKLPVERLFLGAVKPVGVDPAWSPRAELSLAN